MSGENVVNYKQQGGGEWTIGGILNFLSGSEIQFAGTDKAAVLLALVALSADKVADLGAIGATSAEIDALADMSALGAVTKIEKIAISAPEDGAEQLTGWSLPAKAIVHDVFVDVVTPEDTGASKTMMVGTDSSDGGDTDGYLVGIDLSTAGIKRGKATITAGATEKYFASTTKGELLASFEAGDNVAGDVGTNYEFSDSTMGGKEISWTPGSADFAELVANIFVVYTEVV